MLVKLVGFQISVEGKGQLNLMNFLNSLTAANPGALNKQGGQRLLFINSQHYKEYYAGLVLTVKDHRTYCELVNSEDSMLVRVNELTHDTSLMDFNFFVLNKSSGAGLYQHYHQSCSANLFGDLLKKRFIDYKSIKIKSSIEEISGQVSKSEKRKIAAKFSNKLNFNQMVRKEALKELIEKMKRVKSFQYALAIPEVPQNEFAPLKPFVKIKSERLTFNVKTPTNFVANAIDSFVNSNLLQSGSVEAIDENGIDRIIKILDNPDSFGEYDFDDFAPRLNELNLTNFEQSWVIEELVDKCKGNPAIFTYKRK